GGRRRRAAHPAAPRSVGTGPVLSHLLVAVRDRVRPHVDERAPPRGPTASGSAPTHRGTRGPGRRPPALPAGRGAPALCGRSPDRPGAGHVGAPLARPG